MWTVTVWVLLVLAGAVLGVWLWMRYRLAVYDAQHADELIAANRALPRPGMIRPDARFRDGRLRRDGGPDAG
jgi:hypothetical protein